MLTRAEVRCTRSKGIVHRLAAGALGVFLFCGSAWAASGLDYLASQQNPNGSFGNTPSSLATPYQSTQEVLHAYRLLGLDGQPAYVAALGFLNSETEANTEYLSRRILANGESGLDVQTALVELLARQDSSSGGFGNEPGASASILDTAFALEALARTGYASSQPARAAVGYLLANQHADGGWGEGENASSAYLTALVYRSLSGFRFSLSGVGAALSSAQNYLLAARVGDGWGETFLTALVLSAIVPSLPDLTSVTPAINALKADQSANGSWVDDAYTTALALQALYLVDQPRVDPTKGVVKGVIQDSATGLPLSGAVVTVAGAETLSATTDQYGAYQVVGISAGAINVSAARAGYITATGTATMTAGGVVDFSPRLVKDPTPVPITISGAVIDKASRTPIAGAVVQVVGASLSGVSGADGRFTIAGVPPGTLQLQVSAGGYSGASYSISALSGGTIDLGLVELATGQTGTTAAVVGSVVDAATGQALRNVLISVSGGATASALSDTTGQFALSDLTPGRITIAASLEGYQTANASADLAAGTTVNYVVRLVPTDQPAVITITGKVIDRDTAAPLAGASVSLPLAGVNVTTAPDGSFTLNNVRPGTIAVSISADGYTSVSYSANAPNGGLLALGTIALVRATPIDGNRPPVINSTAPTSIPAGQVYAYNVQASDPDGDSLTFALGNHPNGMTIASNGQVRWVPTVDQVGAQSFTVVVFDSQAGRTQQIANVTVTSGSRSYVITDVQTLSGLYVNAQVPNNYVLGTYVSGANPGFVSASPACPLTWFSGGSNVPAAMNSLERLTAPNSLGAQPATGRDIVMDMGLPYTSVTVFPQIDHGPFPQEGIEYTVWGSDNPNAAFPSGWHLASLVSIYRKGYVTTPSCNGQDETDDYAGLYTFGANSYRYIRVRADYSITIFDTPAHTSWNGSGDDGGEPGWQSSEAEIDAVGGMVCDVKPQASAGGDIMGLTGQSIRFDATASQGNILTYGWDLDGDGTIDLTGATPTYVFAAEFDRDVTLMVVDDRGCVGTDQVRVTIGLNLPRPDLTVNSVDTRAVVSDPQTLRVGGSTRVSIQNVGRAAAVTPALVTVFEDTNRNGIYDAGTDNALGSVSMPSGLARGASLSLDVPVNGAVSFRDSPLLAMVDSNAQIVEEREDNNIGRNIGACMAAPLTGTFDPILKWQWTGSATLPNYNQVIGPMLVAPIEDTNGDGMINSLDVPAVIFSTYRDITYSDDGVLRAISGKDGHELWTVTNSAFRTDSEGALATADIDNDGRIEILATTASGNVIAFEHTGAPKWRSAVASPSTHAAIAIADLNGDGAPEIIVGNTVFKADGTLFWQGTGFRGTGDAQKTLFAMPIVADINLDGKPEIIAGASAYSGTGQVLWQNDVVGDGYAAVGNFNEDPYPEIVVVSHGRASLLNYRGELIWGPITLPGGEGAGTRDGNGGAPTVADMDGDGVPEIGIAMLHRYVVLKADGTIFWTAPVQDLSGITGSSVFDFDGDGKAEVVYADELNLYVFRGSDGAAVFQAPNTSGTGIELPVIADVDGDDHADIVVVANDLFQRLGRSPGPSNNGIRVFQDRNNNWVNTRKIWNQHSYHITNINDDGTVPRLERNSWQVQNTYRLNALPERAAPSVADLTIAMLRSTETGGQVRLSARVGNAGAGAAPATSVAFYEGDPNQGGTSLGSVAVAALAAGEYRDIAFDLTAPLSGQRDIYAVVDPANQVTECREDNNRLSTPAKTQSTAGRIAVATDAAAYGPQSPVAISATVTNTSTLPAIFEASLRVEDANGAVITTFATRSVGTLAGGAAAMLDESWNTDGYLAGTYRVRAQLLSVDGDALLDEALATFTIGNAPGDTTPGVALRTTTDRPIYNVTDLVNIEMLVTNTTTNALIDNVTLRLRIKDVAGNILFTHDGPLAQLPPSAFRDVLFPYGLSNVALGTYRVEGEVIDNGTGEVLASSAAQYQVVVDPVKVLAGQVTAASASVEIGASQLCTYTVTNRSAFGLAGLPLRMTVVNVTTGLPADSFTKAVDINASAAQSIVRSVATSSFTPGDYACALEALVDGTYRTLGFAAFKAVEPPIRIQASMAVGAKGRLLILLDSANQCESDDDDEHGKEYDYWRSYTSGHNGCAKDTDPHGPRTAPGLSAQRSFLESLLTQAGWSYTITENADTFSHQLRSGAYTAYALFSEQVKLDEQLQKELREAIFRGDGLLVAGSHDDRNYRLNDALGVKRIGTVDHAESAILASGSALGLDGSISLIPGDRINRIRRITAQRLATYQLSGPSHSGKFDCRCEDPDDDRDDEDCGRTPDAFIDAITLNAYGYGKAAFAGFDLLADATRDGADSVAAKTLLAALDVTHPAPLAARVGAVLPIKLTLLNQGIATTATVAVALPDTVSVIDAGGGTVNNTVPRSIAWTVNLAVAEEKTLTFYVRLPDAVGTVTLNAAVIAGPNQKLITQTSLTLTAAAPPSLDASLARAQALSAANPAYRRALNDAADDVKKAIAARTLDKAIAYVLKATDDLLGIADADIAALRRDLDEWLRYSEMLVN